MRHHGDATAANLPGGVGVAGQLLVLVLCWAFGGAGRAGARDQRSSTGPCARSSVSQRPSVLSWRLVVLDSRRRVNRSPSLLPVK